MHPTYILTSRYYTNTGKTVICQDVYSGENAFDDAIDGFDDEDDVIEVIRLNVGGTWEYITYEAQYAIREALQDAKDMRDHYSSSAACRRTNGASI